VKSNLLRAIETFTSGRTRVGGGRLGREHGGAGAIQCALGDHVVLVASGANYIAEKCSNEPLAASKPSEKAIMRRVLLVDDAAAGVPCLGYRRDFVASHALQG